jgi:hypothetical protein
MGSEVRAENFDSAYKGIGDGKTLTDKLAHAVAGTMASLGFNPVAGRYSDLGFPLDYATMKQGLKQSAVNKPLVSPSKLPKVVAPVGSPAAATQQQKRHEEIVKTAPDVALPGAAKSPREMMGILNEAVLSGSPVDIHYGHAGGTAPAAGTGDLPEAALGGVSRADRREVIEAWRQLPIATRSFMATLFSPERFDVTKGGKYQVYGGSHAVLAANLQKLANFSIAHPEVKLPDGWNVDDKSFTPDSWNTILDQVQKYSRNQLTGRAGSGQPLVVPKMKGYFAPPVTGEAAVIPQDAADAINAVFGQTTPATARIMKKDVVPLNLAGQRIAEATLPGRVEAPTAESPEFEGETAKGLGIEGQHVLEPNPFLQELNKFSDAPSFIEARRRLNLEHMADVEHAPAGSPSLRGNTLTMAAGFRPELLPDKENVGRWPRFSHLVGMWLSPDGDFYDATPTHYHSAEKYITGVTKEDPRELAYKKQWVRVNIDGGSADAQILIEGPKPNPTQMRALDSAAESQGLPVNNDSGRTVIEAPAGFRPELRGNEDIQQVADRYMKATGRPYTRPTAATPLNEAVAKRIADFYQSAAHSPDSPEVQSSYKAMADETVQQWNALEKAGYKMEPWTKPGQPYGSSAEMTADVRDNHHLWFFPTEAGYGTGTEIAKHPLLEDSGVQVNGRELPYNDVFRAVHDVMGHAKEGYEFGPKGELNAYLAHSAMYSDAAKPAMASETLGQNSWVNFGEHLRTPEGNIPKKGEAGFVPAPERPFAEQKAFLLPENLQKLSLDDESAQFKPRKRKDDWQLKEGPGMFSKAWIAPDGKPIQLGGQWHHEWVNENPDVAEKYGLKPTTSGEENRSEALQKGFARVNYEKNTGTFKVEARQQDWDKLSPSVLEMVKRNLGKIDNMDVHLLDAKGKNIVDQDGVALHTYDAGEKLDHIPLISEPSSTVTETSPQATGKAESAQFRPADEDTQILYSGKGGGVGSGEGGSWWTSSLRRAISFGPSVSRVEVPKEIAQAAREAALKQGSGTSTDFVLPNEWVKKAEPVGELDQPTYELPIQFRPDETNPRAVKMAALRDEDTGKIYEGPMHAFAKLEYLKEKYASRLDENGDLPDNLMLQAWKADPNLSEGFTTNAGEFLSRDEAKDRAVELKQYVAKPNEGSSLESQAFTRQQELQKAGYAPDVQYRPSAKPEDFKSEETLPRALQSPNWAIFTATKEDLGPGTNEHNELRNENLEKALVADGFTPTEVSGNYKGVDQGKSFLVPNMTPEQATAWGNKYGQESVLTPHGILYGDGTINPADHSKTVVGPEAEKQDFYSKLKDGPAFSMGIDTDKRVQFKPNTPEERDLLGAAIAPQAFSKAEVMAMSNKDLLEHYPEAVVPNKVRNKKGKLVEPELTSDIVHAPLVEANGGAESPKAIKAYAQKVVDFAKQWQDHPAFKDGMKWYSDFVPKLKANFGKNAQLFAELLAATSPNTTPDVNFGFAYDALKSFETGKFDQQIAKFNEGMKMADEDNWQDWYNKNVPESDRPVKPTKATFMAEWIDQHDLAPRQSNGKNYGMHSVPVLQVLARRWLNQTTGPKTQNFIKNLVGSEHEATIDVWADRTMRRLGYQDYQDRWRILPKNATGVPDTDFHFSQKVFRAAANQMDIKPDALQGALWFAEKQLWADKGWGRLDLGDYRKEMAKVPELQKRFEQRNAQQEMNLVAPRPGVQYNPGMKLVKATVQDKNGGILIGGGKSITSSPLTPVDASAWADAIISNQIGLPASQYGTKDQRRNKDDFKVTIR